MTCTHDGFIAMIYIVIFGMYHNGFLLGVNQYIDISICIGIRLSGDIRYIVLMIRQYNVGFENSTFNRLARSSKFQYGLKQKANKF